MMLKIKNVVSIFAILALGACTSIPMKTIYKLATTDPMTVDPNQLHAAVRMPEWIAPKKDGVTLALTSRPYGESPLTERFILESISLATEGNALSAERKAGYKLYAYQIAPKDIPRFLAFRNQAKQKGIKSGKKSTGNIELSADGCRKTAIPEGKILVSTYLRFEAGMDYFPVLSDYDLRQILNKEALLTKIPLCDE